MRVLGVDPGSRLTGYGCIDIAGKQLSLVTHGTLKIASTSGRATMPLEDRLHLIHEGLSRVILEFKPQILVVEKVFFAKNAVSALKLGQARGAAILTGKIHGLEIAEYNPSEVKAAVVGHGAADKSEVAKMLQLIFGKQDFVTSDASDGLALALCHAYRAVMNRHPGSKESLKREPIRRKKNLSLAESVAHATQGKTKGFNT